MTEKNGSSPEISEDIEEEGIEQLPITARVISAPYCDAYIVSVFPNIVRIAFGEALEGETYYRTAIAMPLREAEDLARSILESIKQQRATKSIG
jgi:hypothetical protein